MISHQLLNFIHGVIFVQMFVVLSCVLHRTVIVLEKQDNEAFGFDVQVCWVTNVLMASNACRSLTSF